MSQVIGIKNINRTLIDSLMDVRLTLSVRRMTGKTIKQSELKNVVDDVRSKITDQQVEKRLTEVFDEFFGNKKQDGNEVKKQTQPNNIISLSEMEGMFNQENSYTQENNNGNSIVKRDKHFATNPEGRKDAA